MNKVDVACFGMITPAMVIVVEELPAWNEGAVWKEGKEFISDDAAIVAVLLSQWGVSAGLIGTILGDDPRGRETAQALRDAGVAGEFRLSPDVTTPFEINVSDGTGGRTYFWRRDPEVLDTLDSADLSLLNEAKLLYVDWYDGDHILRPMKMAQQLGVPVFLNLEHGHMDASYWERLAPFVSICQAVTNADQTADNANEVADKLLKGGVDTTLVTMAKDGCLVATRQERLRLQALTVDVVDGCAAGATFSAGFQYGVLNNWTLEESARFAAAAGSLQCTVVGPAAFPIAEIRELGQSLKVERLDHSFGTY